jgi:hypothetical protein
MGEPAEAMPAPGVIRLSRQQGFYRDHFGRYRVRIDGHPAGWMAEGETKDFPVPPGEHRVRLTMDRFWTSREVTLQVHAGELAEFTCRPSASTTASMVLLYMRPHRWIRLDGPVVAGRT